MFKRNKVFVALVLFLINALIGPASGLSGFNAGRVYAAVTSYEAEASGNTLSNSAAIVNSSNCSGGKKVGNLGGSSNGTVKINNVDAPSNGTYTMTVYYCSGDPRDFYVTVNTQPYEKLSCPATGGWNTVGSITKTVTLTAGNNTIKFDNGAGWAPDLDRITIDTGTAQKVATPAFSPAGGTYTSVQSVTLSCATSGATIRYTTDGSTPTSSSQVYGTPISVSNTASPTTIKAIAMKTGMTDSDIVSATYTINPPSNQYEAEASGNTLTNGAAIANSSNCSGGKKVGYLGGSSNGSVTINNVAASTAGSYTMTIYYCAGDSTRAFHISVNGGAYINLPCASTGGWDTVGTATQVISLNSGNNTIKFDNNSGWAGDLDKIAIAYNGQQEQVAAPTFSPAGGTYTSAQSVTLSCATSGATIRYTTDGSDPNSTSPVYSAPINTPLGTTIKAYATKSGMRDSIIAAATYTDANSVINLTNGNVRVEYDMTTGLANFYSSNVKKIANFFSEVKINGTIYTSKDYTGRTYTTNGSETVVTCTASGKPTMKQHFYMTGTDNFLVLVEVTGTNLSSNMMAPVKTTTAGGVDVGSYGDVRGLWVPWDNDKDVKYDSSGINRTDTSFEYSVFFDNNTRNGIVVGSVTHDTWKTGVTFTGNGNKLDTLSVYGGVKVNISGHGNLMQRDVMDHGAITGNTLVSPKIFVGYFADWRDGLEKFGDENAAVVGKFESTFGVPFGWNSWGALGTGLNYTKAAQSADWIKNNLMNNNFHNDSTTIIGLDSYWDNMTGNELTAFVNKCHENVQKAGIYWAPFVDWAKNGSATVQGSSYIYSDIWLKDSSGNPIENSGAYSLDPTHPGTKQRINYYVDMFKGYGFDYIKIDFTANAALEGGSNNGVHYDTNVKTGIQAYNQGMQYFKDRVGGTMFISMAISPIFPYQYANARRVSSDKYGYNFETRDEMNSAAFAWWMNDKLYQYNDPDHMSTYKPYWGGSVMTAAEAQARVTSGAISGTVYLSADDMTEPNAQNSARTYLTNTNINSIARKGKAFRPVDLSPDQAAIAPNLYIMDDGGVYYIAVFNWNTSASASFGINLARAGLSEATTYTVTDQWSGSTSTATGTLNVAVDAGGVKIYKLQ